eukprot:9638667-Alexandrium_andersonii.AAC.1
MSAWACARSNQATPAAGELRRGDMEEDEEAVSLPSTPPSSPVDLASNPEVQSLTSDDEEATQVAPLADQVMEVYSPPRVVA